MASFDEFITAQDEVLPAVLAELRAGRKQTHWMWFIFPQLAALGRSPTAKFYGIIDLDEARAYMAHPVLGPRLVGCTRLVNAVAGRSAHDIFGPPDDLKFHSSITLFHRAAPDEGSFSEALRKYFGGVADARTLELLAGG